MPTPSSPPVDVVVVGGGPAGLAAALWAARYRRRVLLIDAGEHRNRWAAATHGYLGIEDQPPADIIASARKGLDRYPEIEVRGTRVLKAATAADGMFELELEDGVAVAALRVVLATGVRDVFPGVEGFEQYFGRSIFTCPSCDGYEAQGKAVAVVGDTAEIAEFALGLLDWARSVVLVRQRPDAATFTDRARDRHEVRDLFGTVTAVTGVNGQVQSLLIDDGRSVPCEAVFWLMRHEQQSDLAGQLGCDISEDGCVVVDDECATSARHVYAAGDMTPGPHLVQIAAAEGARAGIAAAASLRGEAGSPMSPVPAPDPDLLTEPQQA